MILNEKNLNDLFTKINDQHTSLNICEIKLQNFINGSMGKLVKTLKIGGYIIQFFKPKV